MSAAELRWDGDLVRVVQAGAVRSVTYRHAVSLVSRGLATWAPVETEKPKRAPSGPVKAPPKPVQSSVVESIVSAPPKRVEGDQAGYEPPLPDL